MNPDNPSPKDIEPQGDIDALQPKAAAQPDGAAAPDAAQPASAAAPADGAAQSVSAADGADSAPAVPSVVHKGWIPVVLLGLLLTFVAWCAMLFNEYVSFWSGVAGAVVSLAGAIKVGRGFWRDFAITCFIACVVLLLVYGIFYFTILYAINSL